MTSSPKWCGDKLYFSPANPTEDAATAGKMNILQGIHAKVLSLEEGEDISEHRNDSIQRTSIIIDSGATKHVLSSKECKDVPLKSTAKSRSGYEYETADGVTVVNEGERGIVFATREGRLNQLAFQVANINKGLGNSAPTLSAAIALGRTA